MIHRRITQPAVILPVILLTALGILLAREPSVRYVCAYVLVFVLPGFALVELVLGRRHGLASFEKIALCLAAGYPMATAVTLVASYVPGKLTLPIALAAYVSVALLTWALAWLRSSNAEPIPRCRAVPATSVIVLGIIVLLAGFFLFTNLGTSEFQGDEVMTLLDGGSGIQGNDSALFFHRKGPVEIVLPVSLWILTGTITEWMARLPFAVAGILTVIAVYSLGRRAFNEWTGLATAALMAVNGYLVGFSRIVQYQSVIMMTTAMAILCFYLLLRSDNGLSALTPSLSPYTGRGERSPSPRIGSGWGPCQILGATFVATGLLAHYDGVFALPVVAYLYARNLKGLRRHWRSFLIALLIGVGLVALFYVPFFRAESFSQTTDYLQFRSGDKPFYNNLSLWFATSTTYNSTYYVVVLVVLALIGILGQMEGRGRWLQGALLLVFAMVVCAVAFPDAWRVDGHTLVFVPFVATVVLAYLVFEPSAVARTMGGSINPDGPQMALVWFAAPFLVYSFLLIERPGTHFWTMFSALVLLGAFGFDTLRLRLQARGLRKPTLAVLGASLSVAMLALFAYYLYLVFIRIHPDYRTAGPETTGRIYWTVHEDPPARDYFGFPHKAGWKTVSALYDQGILDGEYDSNEGGEITAWYLAQAPRHYCKPVPRYYFMAETVQDVEEVISEEELSARFSEVGLVTVNGRPGIHIYERNAPQGSIIEYPAEEWEQDFDRSREPWDRLATMGQFVSTPHAVVFDEGIELVGYDLDTADSRPAGEIVLTLYWQRKGGPTQESYKVFTHLEGERLWAQADDIPGCSAWPTTNWRDGEIVADRHILELGPDIPPGEYSLSVGLYEPVQGTRLNWLDHDGAPQGDSLTLASVDVESSD